VQGSLVGELEAHGYFRKLKFLKRVFWSIEYLITRMADRFVCSSQNTVDILCQLFNVNPDNVFLVNDGADEFEVNSKESLASELGLPDDIPVVIFTGALLEAKGLGYLCEAILETKKSEMRCHFLIVGYPEKVIQDFCKQNDLQDICSIAGRVPYERLGDYLALADLALEPKRSDSGEASGKLLNYMGAALPVVCFDTKCNRQVLGEHGYYAKTTTLAEQIKLVIEDSEKAVAAGLAGKLRVDDKFSWRAAGEKIHSVYKSCLK
jgi:glycosyltransferase involved in cell wall biosynthesis